MKRSPLNSFIALLLLLLGIVALGTLLLAGKSFDAIVLTCGLIACLDTFAASIFVFFLR